MFVKYYYLKHKFVNQDIYFMFIGITPRQRTLRYMAVRWSRPPLRRFKFNVDGASRGNGL